MRIVEIGNLADTRLVAGVNCDRVPRVGIIIEATPGELAALPFNPVYAEVEVRPAKEARDER
jgi:hypothetical protein